MSKSQGNNLELYTPWWDGKIQVFGSEKGEEPYVITEGDGQRAATFAEMAKKMAEAGVYAGPVEVYCLSKKLDWTVVIMRPSENGDALVLNVASGKSTVPPLILWYEASHYERLLRKGNVRESKRKGLP